MRANTINKYFFNNKSHLVKLKNWNAAYNYCSKENNKIITNEINEPIKLITDDLFFDWQKDLIKIINSEPDDRKIYWYYGEQGVGKTQFIKYCCIKYGAIILSGKPSDMKNGIVEYKKKNHKLPKIIFSNIGFDVDLKLINYSGYEDIKDMTFYSGKYEGL